MKILKNLSIPSTMTADGLEYLGRMAREVPPGGTIVEIGPLFGSSTWVLAKNAHPSVKVFSIDTWEPAAWIDKVEARYMRCKPFSKDAFLYYTRDCPNVTAIQGWSPSVVGDWDLPIDMFFDDATHGDPGFSENVNFFLPFVKEGGILCGDDYSSGWPDIVKVVDRKAAEFGVYPEVSGRVWAIRKPKVDAKSEQKIYQSLPANPRKNNISVSCESVDGQRYRPSPEVWSGAVHKPARLSKLSLTKNFETANLDLQWLVKDSKEQWHGPFSSAYEYKCDADDWISGIAIRLSGDEAKNYTVEYQATFAWFTGRSKRYGASSACRNGGQLESDNPKKAITSIRTKVMLKRDIRQRKIQSFIDSTLYLRPSITLKKILQELKKRLTK